ncbi:MAG: carbon-nitrogen hydrolase family protein [Chloroflexi bacterium]|nr:carbon-nitrogen hydrolase family protein [Chloroflexota bacterium]
MISLKVALLQMLSSGVDQDDNLHKGEEFCRRAAAQGADIALFPEMWNIGYSFFDRRQKGARAEWAARAVGAQDAFVQHFQELARTLGMAIALTYLEKWPAAPRNSVSLIDRHGDIRFTYAKVHTCDFDVERYLTDGDDFFVTELDTKSGPVKVGAMICYDREFPESARILMLKGAELILVPNACEMEANRTGQLRTRAYENMLGVALANYAAPQEKGHSVAFDGMGFTKNGATRDTLLVEAGEAEGIYLAEFDLERLREWRRRETWGNAFRKPRRYDLLTSLAVEEPFKRKEDRRGR